MRALCAPVCTVSAGMQVDTCSKGPQWECVRVHLVDEATWQHSTRHLERVGRVRRHGFPRTPRFPRRRVGDAPADWNTAVDEFDRDFDKRLALRRNDCVTYADGLIEHLTGVRNAHSQLQGSNTFEHIAASGLDAGSW